MSTTTKPSKNGQKKAEANKVATPQKSTTKVDEVLKPSAESRLKKLENFQILAERHKFLVKKKDELQKFIVSSDGMKEKIVLKNSQGFQLEVSNSQVIEKVVYLIKEQLDQITENSEKEVLNFSI